MAPVCYGGESRYKLSKPRRRTATGLIVSPGGSRSDLDTFFTKESSSSSVAIESLDTFTSQYSRKSLRESFFGDGTPLRKEVDSEEEEGEDDVDVSKSMLKRFSRANASMTKRASMRMSFGLSRSFTNDPKDDSTHPEVDPNINDVIKKKAYRDKMMALNQSLQTTMDDCGIRERIISPIRRRSFFTPGLATRNPVDILAKPPLPTKKEQEQFEYYYNPKLSLSSPLELIAALDLANRPLTPLMRAVTPAETDYGLIGRLRITNGLASPAPSIRSYSTVSRPLPTPFRNSLSCFDITATHRLDESIGSLSQQPRRSYNSAYYDVKTASDQQIEDLDGDEIATNYSEADGFSDMTSGSEDEHGGDSTKKASKSFPALSYSERAFLRARDYRSGLARNPFDTTSSSPILSSFETTTKPSEMEAELFDEHSLKQTISIESMKPTSIVLPDIAIEEDDFEQSTSRLLSLVGSLSPTSDTIEREPISVCKSDSGYSSNTSTNPSRKKLGFDTGPSVIQKAKVVIPDQSSNHQRVAIISEQRPSPVRISTTTTIQDSIFTASVQNSTDTIPTIGSSTTVHVNKSQESIPKKLTKARPRSQPPPSNRISVQIHPKIDPEFVPCIPMELAKRLARRIANLPTLDHTLPSIAHIRLEKADLVPGPLSAPIRSPSPQPTVDLVWDQIMGPNSRQPKTGRRKFSLIESLQPKKSKLKPKLVQSESRYKNASSLGDIHSFLQISYQVNDKVQSKPTKGKEGSFPSPPIPPTMPRSRSMMPLMNDTSVKLADLRPIAESAADKSDAQITMSSPSAVITSTSAMIVKQWTGGKLESRQDSSVPIVTGKPCPRPDFIVVSKTSAAVTNSTAVSSDENSKNLSNHAGSTQIRRSSYDLLNNPGAFVGRSPQIDSFWKALPPVPSIPVVEQVKIYEKTIKQAEGEDQYPSTSPSQKHNSAGCSNSEKPLPYRESVDWTTSQQKWAQFRASATTTSLSSPVFKDLYIAGTNQGTSSSMNSKLPLLPSIDWRPSRPHLNRSPDLGRQPTLPSLAWQSAPQGTNEICSQNRYSVQAPTMGSSGPLYNQHSRHSLEFRLQDMQGQPLNWTPHSPSQRSKSPERLHYRWLPPKLDSPHPQQNFTEWPQASIPSSQTWQTTMDPPSRRPHQILQQRVYPAVLTED